MCVLCRTLESPVSALAEVVTQLFLLKRSNVRAKAYSSITAKPNVIKSNFTANVEATCGKLMKNFSPSSHPTRILEISNYVLAIQSDLISGKMESTLFAVACITVSKNYALVSLFEFCCYLIVVFFAAVN